MKVAFLGGSFNPIHYGHLDLADAAVREFSLEKVIFIPNHINPIKANRTKTTDSQRLDMINLAIEGDERYELDRFEVDKEGFSFTVDTVEYLRKKYSDIAMICGADLIFEIERWKDYDKLLRELTFLIANRPPYEREELEEKAQYYRMRFGSDIRIIRSFEMTEISSTKIREDIKRKNPLNIPEKVAKYIIDNKLYLD